MAEILDEEYDFYAHRTRYPWGLWLDGQTWRLTRGIDFQVDVPSMRTTVYNAGRARGLKVRTTAENGTCIVIRADQQPF